METVPIRGKEAYVVGQGRTVGLIFILVAIVIIVAAGLYLWSGLGRHLDKPAAILGMFLVLILTLPLIGAGVFLYVRGRGEEQQFAQAAQEK
jgi:divalent metal cation (Fe/Co/Zn/Cd) transporter